MALIKVFVIDDQADNVRTFMQFLTLKNGFEFYSNKQPATAYRIITQNVVSTPDVIITDWAMPGIDGIDLIKKFKANPVTRNIPIIMATGINTSDDHLEEALSVGACDFLRKPINKVELMARITTAYRNYFAYKSEIEAKKRELLGRQILIENQRNVLLQIQKSLGNQNFEQAEHIAQKHINNETEVKIFIAQYAETNPEFFRLLEQRVKKVGERLTIKNKQFLAYLGLGIDNQRLEMILGVSAQGVARSKLRLREKLGFADAESFRQFIEEISLCT